MLSGEATNTNFIVFGLTSPGLELTIYEHTTQRVGLEQSGPHHHLIEN
jgi:hypothetical protein